FGIDYNSIFQFTDIPFGTSCVVTFTINKFVGGNLTNANTENISILDFSLINDIDSVSDLGFDDDGTDLTITHNSNGAFQIILEGMVETDLNANNLIF
ncbi:MAG: hypothetical protein AAFW01_20320, partial [Pseudomonadota bacterium]